jgi:hypothetical protein
MSEWIVPKEILERLAALEERCDIHAGVGTSTAERLNQLTERVESIAHGLEEHDNRLRRLEALVLDPSERAEEEGPCGLLVPVEDLTEALKVLHRARGCLLQASFSSEPEFEWHPRFPKTLKAIDQLMAKMGYEHDPSETDEVG